MNTPTKKIKGTLTQNREPTMDCGRTHSGDHPPHLDALAREAMRHRARAAEHVRRRGFSDIADDAVAEALHHLVRRAVRPDFVPPTIVKAWLIRWSVCAAFVLRRHGERLDTVRFDEALEACEPSGVEGTGHGTVLAPDERLLAQVEEMEHTERTERIAAANAALSATDRDALVDEILRVERGEAATPRHRKRLERARRRARSTFARFGIHGAMGAARRARQSVRRTS